MEETTPMLSEHDNDRATINATHRQNMMKPLLTQWDHDEAMKNYKDAQSTVSPTHSQKFGRDSSDWDGEEEELLRSSKKSAGGIKKPSGKSCDSNNSSVFQKNTSSSGDHSDVDLHSDDGRDDNDPAIKGEMTNHDRANPSQMSESRDFRLGVSASQSITHLSKFLDSEELLQQRNDDNEKNRMTRALIEEHAHRTRQQLGQLISTTEQAPSHHNRNSSRDFRYYPQETTASMVADWSTAEEARNKSRNFRNASGFYSPNRVIGHPARETFCQPKESYVFPSPDSSKRDFAVSSYGEGFCQAGEGLVTGSSSRVMHSGPRMRFSGENKKKGYQRLEKKAAEKRGVICAALLIFCGIIFGAGVLPLVLSYIAPSTGHAIFSGFFREMDQIGHDVQDQFAGMRGYLRREPQVVESNYKPAEQPTTIVA